jgi:hypothetical protein
MHTNYEQQEIYRPSIYIHDLSILHFTEGEVDLMKVCFDVYELVSYRTGFGERFMVRDD